MTFIKRIYWNVYIIRYLWIRREGDVERSIFYKLRKLKNCMLGYIWWKTYRIGIYKQGHLISDIFKCKKVSTVICVDILVPHEE